MKPTDEWLRLYWNIHRGKYGSASTVSEPVGYQSEDYGRSFTHILMQIIMNVNGHCGSL